jgi:hypothetical protein
MPGLNIFFRCDLRKALFALVVIKSRLCRESQTRPRVVGEFRKTCHPRNVEVHEIREICFQGQRNHEDLESGTHEVSESRMRDGQESRTLEASESRTRDGSESWTCEASKSRIREDSKPWTCGATNFGNLWNSGIWWRTSSGVTVREDFLNGEIHELARSKVKVVVSKSPGLVCELVAGLWIYEM